MTELDKIITILKVGGESDSYIDAVQFLHKMIQESKDNGTFDRTTYASTCIAIHNKLRYKYKLDFNSPLLTWYRRFIELYGAVQ